MSAAMTTTAENDCFTFALYFSEKKSKQLCQLLSDYPFVLPDGTRDGTAVAALAGKRIRAVKLVVEDVAPAATPSSAVASDAANNSSSSAAPTALNRLRVRFIDNTGADVDPAAVNVLLQKASVDKDEGRSDRIQAIQRLCDAHNIRIVDPFEPSLDICASRTFVTKRLAGGPAGGGIPSGKVALEMLSWWGFVIPSTYHLRAGRSAPAPLFEEPNAHFKSDVMIVKPEVASQRCYSHDLQVMASTDLVALIKNGTAPHGGHSKSGGGTCSGVGNDNAPALLLPPLVGAEHGCEQWVAQDCVSAFALPVVFKAYTAGDYLSVSCLDATAFNEQYVEKVSATSGGSDGSGDGSSLSLLMKDGAKDMFTPLDTLAQRRAFADRSPAHAEAVNYFQKGSKAYDDLWQTVQFLKRKDNLGVNFFGIDILVVKGIDAQPDRRYIVDVNYLPSYKNEVPQRLHPALVRALMEA